MKVAVLTLENPKLVLNKDYAGGFGAGFQTGNTVMSKVFRWMRKSNEKLPLMSYAYAAAIFRDKGHDVVALTNVIDPTVDFYIIQPSMADYNNELDYIKRIRKETSAKIGIIGPFPKAMPELFEKYVDFIAMNDPETLFQEIASGKPIPEGQVTPDPAILDDLPYPAWDLFDWKNFGKSILLEDKPAFFISGSRGCFYRCNYCPYLVNGDKHKVRDPVKVVDEIEHLINKYGAKALLFRDPLFTGIKKNAIAIAEEIVKRNIKITWMCETRLDQLNREIIDLFYKSGCRCIKVGIESANEEVLKLDNRIPIEIKHQEDIISYCDKKQIKVYAFYIVGHPDDTHETIAQTINYAIKLNTPIAKFTVATPYPGTGFYDRVKDDIFEIDLDKWDAFHSVFKHQNLSKEEIEKYNEQMFTKYYLRPKFIMSHLRRSRWKD